MSNKSNTIIEKYQTLITKDIEHVISYIFEKYNVTDKVKNNTIDKNDVINHFLVKKESVVQRCCGINQTGTRCSRNSLENSCYCKIHIFKYTHSDHIVADKKLAERDNNTLVTDKPNIEIEKVVEPVVNNLDTSTLAKIFIDDTFYFTDENYLYDTSNLERVGIVDGSEYILINDPFVLNF